MPLTADEAHSRLGEAGHLHALGDEEQARLAYLDAVRDGTAETRAHAQHRLAELDRVAGRCEEALERLDEAESLFCKLGQTRIRAAVLENRASVFETMGNPLDARIAWRKAQAAWRDLGEAWAADAFEYRIERLGDLIQAGLRAERAASKTQRRPGAWLLKLLPYWSRKSAG